MRYLVILLGLLFAVSASAEIVLVPPQPAGMGCTKWLLCDDQATAAACGGAGTERIIRAGNQVNWSAWADESDSDTAWTIQVFDKAPGAGYDGTDRTLLNSDGNMAPANMKFSWYGISGDIHAVIGGTATNGVTLTVKGCR